MKTPYTRVVNVHTTPDYDEYIGRGSPFGNPFMRLPLSTTVSKYNVIPTDDPIRDYERWLRGEIEAPGWRRPTARQIRGLHGKTLGCYCKPKPCHGDVLVRWADDR